MKTILVCGNILSELQLFVDEIARENGVSISDQLNALTSSKVINAARIMALQNKIIFYGYVGEDLDGLKAIKDLKNYGFEIELVQKSETKKTGKVLVATNKDGKYAVYLYFGANENLNIKDIPASVYKKIDAIYTDTGNALQFDYDLIKKANLHNIPIFFDVPNKHSEFDKTKKHKIDFFMPNRQEAGALTNIKIETIKDAEEACFKIREFIDGNILITLDEDGCVLMYKDKSEVLHMTTEKLTAVDSTGVGDIFRGTLCSEIVNGKNISDAIFMANKFAGSSILYKGIDEKIKIVRSLAQFHEK